MNAIFKQLQRDAVKTLELAVQAIALLVATSIGVGAILFVTALS